MEEGSKKIEDWPPPKPGRLDCTNSFKTKNWKREKNKNEVRRLAMLPGYCSHPAMLPCFLPASQPNAGDHVLELMLMLYSNLAALELAHLTHGIIRKEEGCPSPLRLAPLHFDFDFQFMICF